MGFGFRWCWGRTFADIPQRAERCRQMALRYNTYPLRRARFGYVERQIHSALFLSPTKEMSTGELARKIYQDPIFDWAHSRMRDKSEPIPPLKSYHYQRIRLAAPTFADLVGGGRGRRGYRWRLRDESYWDARRRKTNQNDIRAGRPPRYPDDDQGA
jgi:hypothetical protein